MQEAAELGTFILTSSHVDIRDNGRLLTQYNWLLQSMILESLFDERGKAHRFSYSQREVTAMQSL